MKTQNLVNFIILILLLGIIVSCSNRQSLVEIIEIDAYKKYPKLSLDLDEIAEIKYIPLRLGKDTIFIDPGVNRSFFATHDKFFLQDGNMDDPKIVVYDYNGNPLYKIGRKGRGPGEFISPFNYAVDTSRNEIFINSALQDRIIVYDTDGNFKKYADISESLRIRNFDVINNKTLIGYNPTSGYLIPNYLVKGSRMRTSGKILMDLPL